MPRRLKMLPLLLVAALLVPIGAFADRDDDDSDRGRYRRSGWEDVFGRGGQHDSEREQDGREARRHPRDRDDNDDNENNYYRQRGDYRDNRGYQNDRYGSGRNSGSLIGQVMSDINMAASNARLDGHERKHFDEAAQKLQEFQDRWAHGNFDTGKLDKAIGNLEHLANADKVRRRDRDVLNQDLAALREFRSTRGQYSNATYGDYRDGSYNRNHRRYNPYWP